MNYKIKIHNINSNTDIVKIPDDGVFHALSEFINNSNDKLFCHIVSDEVRMKNLQIQMSFFNPDLEVLTFGAWDCAPYDKSSPKSDIIANRIETLFYLKNKIHKKTLIVATINAVIQKNIPISEVVDSGFILKKDNEVNLDKIIEILVNNGYNRSPVADNVGEFAVRGGIIDIINYSQESQNIIGYRLDLFGDILESIRIFDPLTQISEDEVDHIKLLPTKEIILNNKSINNFKRNYRNLFGIAKDDLIYDEIVSGRNISGMEHLCLYFLIAS